MHKTGKVILEAVILAAVVVVSLIFYTFWAAKRGYNFGFLRPFLSASLMALIVFGLIQVNFLHPFHSVLSSEFHPSVLCLKKVFCAKKSCFAGRH